MYQGLRLLTLSEMVLKEPALCSFLEPMVLKGTNFGPFLPLLIDGLERTLTSFLVNGLERSLRLCTFVHGLERS